MTTGRITCIRFLLMLGISLLIPLFSGYALYADLSETVLPSSGLSFEDPDTEDSSPCQNEFKVLVPTLSSSLLSLWTHFGRKSNLVILALQVIPQNKPVLRC